MSHLQKSESANCGLEGEHPCRVVSGPSINACFFCFFQKTPFTDQCAIGLQSRPAGLFSRHTCQKPKEILGLSEIIVFEECNFQGRSYRVRHQSLMWDLLDIDVSTSSILAASTSAYWITRPDGTKLRRMTGSINCIQNDYDREELMNWAGISVDLSEPEPQEGQAILFAKPNFLGLSQELSHEVPFLPNTQTYDFNSLKLGEHTALIGYPRHNYLGKPRIFYDSQKALNFKIKSLQIAHLPEISLEHYEQISFEHAGQNLTLDISTDIASTNLAHMTPMIPASPYYTAADGGILCSKREQQNNEGQLLRFPLHTLAGWHKLVPTRLKINSNWFEVRGEAAFFPYRRYCTTVFGSNYHMGYPLSNRLSQAYGVNPNEDKGEYLDSLFFYRYHLGSQQYKTHAFMATKDEVIDQDFFQSFNPIAGVSGFVIMRNGIEIDDERLLNKPNKSTARSVIAMKTDQNYETTISFITFVWKEILGQGITKSQVVSFLKEKGYTDAFNLDNSGSVQMLFDPKATNSKTEPLTLKSGWAPIDKNSDEIEGNVIESYRPIPTFLGIY